ncbi:MAG: pirin family protein [Myxococcales bacterium]|nr:pirin family protein [Myxococcales bacterium]
MAAARSIAAKVSLGETRMGLGFTSFGLRHLPGYPLDPFLNLDDFRMSEPTFPPHPHAGFSAVTYMFEDSPGAFVNRDSLGDRSRIGPGTLHWTQAAHGMMHEEVPERAGEVCHGLQMFVNLRSDHKNAAPAAFHVEAGDIPEVSLGEGARVRVLAGEFAGRSALPELLTPIVFLDVHLGAWAEAVLPIAAACCFLLVVSGGGTVGVDRTAIQAHDAVGLAADGEDVVLAAGAGGLQLLLGAGRPIGEPVVFGGPFAMTTERDLAAAKARYARGEMGRLERSF